MSESVLVKRRTPLAATALYLVACSVALAQNAAGTAAPAGTSYASVVDQICRRYAEAQKAELVETMYAQCMYARGYLVPGVSPSPNSPGYQGPLLGPATIGGGN